MDLSKLQQKAKDNAPTLSLFNELTDDENMVLGDLKTIIISKVLDTDISVINLHLMHRWLISLYLSGHVDIKIVEHWDKLAPVIMNKAYDFFTQAAKDLDTIPNEDFQELSTQISNMKNMLKQFGYEQINHEALAKEQWSKFEKHLDDYVYPLIEDKDFNNQIIERAFFYYWFRFFTLVKNFKEIDFIKLEHNWDKVYTHFLVECFDDFKTYGIEILSKIDYE